MVRLTNDYAITASAGANGSVSPAGTSLVLAESNQVYTITPNTGYCIADVLVDNSSIGAVSSYTFSNVLTNHTISATFYAQTIYYSDNDSDGYGNPLIDSVACTQPLGYVNNNTDCNDADSLEHAGQVWYLDADGDQYSSGSSITQCSRPVNGFVASELIAISGDCNDANGNIHPGTVEVCDGLDNNCNGLTDNNEPGVLDTILPVPTFANLPNITAQCSVTVTSPTANDNCAGTLTATTVDPITYNTQGSFVIHWTYDDGHGNIVTQNQNVIVDDNTIPVISGCLSSITVNASPGQWGSQVNWTPPTASDNCAIDTLISNYNPGAFFTVGTTTVTYTASDVNGNTATCSFNVTVNAPNITGTVNVTIFANDIQFSNSHPNPNTAITVMATVHNYSNVDATNFSCHLVNDFDNTTYPDTTIPLLAAGQEIQISWTITTPATDEFVPMSVWIDYGNALAESNELENHAIRPFINGQPALGGAIKVIANANPNPGYTGQAMTVCGKAWYDNLAQPLPDTSVAGATVMLTINQTGEVYYTTTNSLGNYCFNFAAANDTGNYTYLVSVTDFTLTGDTTGNYNLILSPCLLDLSVSMEVDGSYLCQSVNYIAAGSSITGVVHVQNNCQAISQTTTLFVTTTGTPIPGTFTIPPLAPGQIYDVILPAIVFNTPGTTYISATVDYYNILNESSEINNSVATVINVVPNQPDIIPVGLGISNYYQCFQSEVVARIFNAGATATGNFSARLNVYYNNVLEFTSLQPVSSIQGRCTETVSFLFSPLNIGNYTFEVISDYDSIINESSEINNNLIVPYTFQQCFPDLKVYSCGSMDVKPTDPISPGTISLYAEIANEGQLTAIAPFVVNFNVAGINYPVTINSNLPAGDTILVSLTAATPAYGNNTLIVSADYANTVTESFEYNNDASAALCWDFATSNADCTGNPLNEVFQSACVPANIRVALYNFGLYEASQSEVKFEVSGPGIIGWLSLGTSVIFTDNTCICPYIVAAPGSFSYPQTGTYQIRITADPNGLYTECNETNNQIIFSVNVADIPDLTIYSQYIAPSLLNPQINQSITMNVTYKNIGCSAAPASELFVKVDNMPLDSVTAPALAANAFNTVAIGNSWSSFISGFHVIRAIIDNDNQIVEGGESNNEATRSVYVGHAPNFKATNLVVNEMYPQNGENVTLTATITNNGSYRGTGTIQFLYKVSQNAEVLISQQSLKLLQGQTANISQSWFVVDAHADIIVRIVSVTPTEIDFTDNEKHVHLSPPVISLNANHVSCFGLSDGSITTMVTGGRAPLQIRWSNNASGNSISNLNAGTYVAEVTDADGLTNTYSIIITQPLALSTSATSTAILCNGDSSTVTITASGGIAPYSGTGTFTQVQGSYSYTVTDAHGCTATASLVITEPPAISISETHTDASCYNLNNGSVDLSVTGGVAPYSYQWSNNATVQDLLAVTAGTYTVTVTDSNFCTATTSVVISEPGDLTISCNVLNQVSCNGASDGAVNLFVTGGIAPYAIVPATNNLVAGVYTFVVTDANGCQDSCTVTITEPNVLTATCTATNATYFEALDGTGSVLVSGGTAPYAYLWSNGATTANITGLAAGTYTVTVTDFNGCVTSCAITVTHPINLIYKVINSANPTSTMPYSGSITTSTSGGTLPVNNW